MTKFKKQLKDLGYSKEKEDARIEKLMRDTFGDIEKSAKQRRIDEFAKTILPSVYTHGIDAGLDVCSGVEECYDIAEAMEAERERRINELNKQK